MIAQAFEFETQRVRIEDRSGQPWFIAADVCSVLGIGNTSDAVARLDDDEKGVAVVDTLGGPQRATTINESGLYALILRSRKQSARRFRKWVTADVLPSIRRTGSYGAAAAPLDLSDPATLHRLILDHTGRALAAQERLAQLEPQAEALSQLSDASGLLCITDAAKALGVGPQRLFKWLNQHEWIYRRQGHDRWLGFQAKVNAGHIEHKVTRLSMADGTAKMVEQVLITPKGLARLATLKAGS